ncbi:MAG: Eco57I restriction-modification methylase domain-containing protein [Candidatus Sumerlaeaceae bacterium]
MLDGTSNLMIDPQLLHDVHDRDSLVALLKKSETQQGLGWPVDPDAPFQFEPEIAKGIKSGLNVAISRLVPASSEDKHLVLLAEFPQPYVRRDLRELLASLRKHIRDTKRFADHTGIGDTVFIVAGPAYDDVRFVLFEERERRLPRIRSFGWSRAHIGRTVLTHNLGRLVWSSREKWESAWDVEALTDEFYQEFVKVFDAVKAATTHPGNNEKKHAYVQQLLNRMLFIAFIERMGWLKLPWPDATKPTTDYMHALWIRHQQEEDPAAYYKSVVEPSLAPISFNSVLGKLFFDGLNRAGGIAHGHTLYKLLGDVPYLDGGLFEEEATLDVPGVSVQDEVFDLILGDRRPGFDGGLFRRFNFTVTESTPLDQEVAVDPEMLGKIFESIILDVERHSTGTYYTPRPIVEFMVNEVLKDYLTEKGLAADKAALLVDEDNVESDELSFKPSEMQDTLNLLFEVRAVDPACGSGAYLLTLLQRLFELVDRLEVVHDKGRNTDPRHFYNTKLRLLHRCIYGVDISEIAIRIARLRLWLSLVIENKGIIPEPLPSFDFLIMCGDSLASPVEQNEAGLAYPHNTIQDYTVLKQRWFHPSNNTRPEREVLTRKRAEIAAAFEHELASSRFRAAAQNPFDWEVEFAEVFDPNFDNSPGFDIILANPPYGIAVESQYRVSINSKESYAAFLALAHALSTPGGTCSFIVPTSWQTGEHFFQFRSWLFGNNIVHSVVNLPYDMFAAAYVDTCIVTFRARARTVSGREISIAVLPKHAEYRREDIASALRKLPFKAIESDSRLRIVVNPDAVDLITKVSVGSRLDSKAVVKRGIEAYNYKIALKPTTPSMLPFYEGTVRRYYAGSLMEDKWVQPKPREVELHCGERILLRRLVSRSNRLMAARVNFDAVVKKDLYIVRTEGTEMLLFLLGLLNSSLWSYLYLSRSASAQKDDFRQVTLEGIRGLPLPESRAQRGAIAELVCAIERRVAANESYDLLDAELDTHIYALYGVSNEEQSAVLKYLDTRG